MSGRRIEDYALIGDCETAALVGRDGSIDWLCWPRFDSEACFAALLGGPEHGRWSIAPTCEILETSRRYRRETLVLETTFETDRGTATLIDFMPVRGGVANLVRIVVGRRGEVPIRMELALRFGYGQRAPWVRRTKVHDLKALAGPHAAVLETPATCRGEDMKTVADFTVREGQRVPFVLTYGPSHQPPDEAADAERSLDATVTFWNEWCGRCNYDGPWADEVKQSLIVVKALTYRPTGGIIAAPTTSLPERAGGNRNWDYRYCWLRDATFALLTLINAGYREEAEAWTDWLLRAVAGMPDQVQPTYGIAGEASLEERIFGDLPGFNGARPVRIGNAAYRQRQLDVFGEVMDVMHYARLSEFELDDADWNFQSALVSHLEKIWREPDEGIWEVRGGRQHFVHSKVMAWVAFDRTVKAIRNYGFPGPLERWSRLRDRIHAEICERGFDRERGAFVQAYGSRELDSATLLIPLVGFLPADDPRVVGTVRAIERELMDGGLVMRYRTDRTDDGLPPGEGAFLACSFWLAQNLVLQGRHEEARALFERLLSLRNDVGLLAEEYDTDSRAQIGNFPQVLSHLSLVDTAFDLARTTGPAKRRSEEGEPGDRSISRSELTRDIPVPRV